MIALLAAARRVRMALTAKAREDARVTATATAATITATAAAATAAIIAAAEQGAVQVVATQSSARAQLQAQAGAAGAHVRPQNSGAQQARAAREAEDRMLDQLKAQCIADDIDVGVLRAEAGKATSRAEQAEHRAKVLQQAHGREVRDLEIDAGFGGMVSGRLEGQLAAERQVCVLRKERLESALVLDKERADRAELSVAMVWECLEREKVGS